MRATVPGQSTSGLYMEITSRIPARLVGAQSPLAKRVEIHTMSTEGGVMRMRSVAAIELAPDKPVAIQPGGYHLMLIGITQQIKPGDTVPVTLRLEAAGGVSITTKIEAIARAPTH